MFEIYQYRIFREITNLCVLFIKNAYSSSVVDYFVSELILAPEPWTQTLITYSHLRVDLLPYLSDNIALFCYVL
jgi:hypothetical protein